METERRYTPGKVELRGTNDTPIIGGYAAVYDSLSKNLGGFVERVAPAAFNRAAGRNWTDVICRYNHDQNMLLGTTASGTLRLSVDNHGLAYEVHPPQARGDIVELVQRGDVRHSSFAFRDHEVEWSKSDQGYPLRTLHSLELVDVAPTGSPAYLDTSAALRSLADHFSVAFEEIQTLAKQDELRSLFSATGPSVNKRENQMTTAAARAQLLDAAEKF